MSLIRTALLESVVQSGSMMAARLSLIAATFIIGVFRPLNDVIQFDSFALGATFIALGLGFGMESGMSLLAKEDSSEQRHLMLWVALAFPACLVLPLGIAVWGASFLLDPVLLTWKQWGLAVIFGYLQANLSIAYSFDRFSGSAIRISLKILAVNLLGFSAGTVALAQGGLVSDFMVLYASALGLGNLWMIPPLLWRHRVSCKGHEEILATFRMLAGFSVWFLLSSLTLFLRRPIERMAVLSFSSPAMLGGYIILSRLAELVGLVGTVLSSGFMPIVIRRYHDRDGMGKSLARKLLNGYCVLSILLLIGALVLWPLYLYRIEFPPEFPVMSVLFLLVTANIFIGGASLSGQGFVLTHKSYFVGAAGGVLIATFAAFTALFILLGLGIWATPFGLLGAAVIYILLIVQGSEYLAPVGFSIWRQIGWMIGLIGLAFALGQWVQR